MKQFKKALCMLLVMCMMVSVAAVITLPVSAAAASRTPVKNTSQVMYLDELGTRGSPWTPINSGNKSWNLQDNYSSFQLQAGIEKDGGKYGVKLPANGTALTMQKWLLSSGSDKIFSVHMKVVGADFSATGGELTTDATWYTGANDDAVMQSNQNDEKRLKYDYITFKNDEWITVIVDMSVDNNWVAKTTNGQFPANNCLASLHLPNLNKDNAQPNAYYIIDYIGVFDTVADAEEEATANEELWDELQGKPVASVESGKIFANKNVELTTTDADATIYYTTDGSTPTNESATYTEAIEINATTTLKAVAYNETTSTYSSVSTYEYVMSNDRTLNTGTAGILRFTEDDPFTTLGTTSNDTDGNLVIDTPHSDGELLFNDYNGTNSNIQYRLALATHIVVRYKVSGAEYSDEYSNNISFKFMNGGSVKTLNNSSQVTVAVGDGWYETTTALVDVADVFQYGLYYVDFANLPTGQKYIIDYIGFFSDADEMEELKARYRIYDDQSVMLGGAQVKDAENGVRFVGSIDNYQSDVYEEIGFKLKANGVAANKNLVVNKVYDSIIASNEVVTAEMFAAAQSNGKLFTYCVNDITTDVTFEVCVYARIGGTEICGDTYTYLYDVSENSLSLIK